MSYPNLLFSVSYADLQNTKRAFANAKANRTLVFVYLIYIMYKNRSLKLYFKELFSRKDFSKQRKQKTKRSFVKIKQRLTSVFSFK